jgi:hypothetical protein
MKTMKKSKTLLLQTLAAMAAFALVASDALSADNAKKPAPAPAPQAKGKPAAGQPDSSELDISDIQNQYWKAHDKEFEVIQNKIYTKAGRIEIAPVFGLYQRVSFQDTKTLGASIAYHFTEFWGFEVMGY